MENIEITPEVEVNNTETEMTPADNQEVTPDNKEETMGEIQGQPENDKTVGLDKFLDLKKQNKEMKREMESYKEAIQELKSNIQAGATKTEVAKNIQDLAKEYDLDDGFLKKLTGVIRSEVEQDFDAKISPKLAKLEEKEKLEVFENKFNTYFNQTIERMPELDGIANKDVIRQLALNPANADKTVSQLVEETYGGALTGKRTFERGTPNGGKEPEKVDFDRATRDSGYFAEIMANPTLKKEYNDNLHKRIQL